VVWAAQNRAGSTDKLQFSIAIFGSGSESADAKQSLNMEAFWLLFSLSKKASRFESVKPFVHGQFAERFSG
jgi:hypothetical protein